MDLIKCVVIFSYFNFVWSSPEGISNQVFLDDSSTFQLAQNDAGDLLINIKAFGQTFHLLLDQRDQFFDETLTDSEVSYLRGTAFSEKREIGLAFGEFRSGGPSLIL
jgi:hypothetical protein